jgi:hypothetical protein
MCAFDASRPDRALLGNLPFGDEWLALPDPEARAARDPHDAGVRMALYRLLIERSNPGGALGAHDELSPFWGYASQLDWQRRSGRLGAAGSDVIAPASWWGACNYSLSVVPYLAAAQLGIVPALPLPAAAPHFAGALAAWRDTLAPLPRLRRGADLDPLRVAIWRAHLTSIEAAVAAVAVAERALPAAERRFARGWLRMVELFGAAGWRTDLAHLTAQGTGALPPQILDGDTAGFTRAERATVRHVTALAERPRWRWRLETALWRRMMRTPAARADAGTTLATVLGRGTWPARLRALSLAL